MPQHLAFTQEWGATEAPLTWYSEIPTPLVPLPHYNITPGIHPSQVCFIPYLVGHSAHWEDSSYTAHFADLLLLELK